MTASSCDISSNVALAMLFYRPLKRVPPPLTQQGDYENLSVISDLHMAGESVIWSRHALSHHIYGQVTVSGNSIVNASVS